MKLKLTKSVLVIAVLCSCWLFAGTSLKKILDLDSTSWLSELFMTGSHNALALSPPLKKGEIFAEDFEGVYDWALINSDVNKWYVDTIAKNGPNKLLFISDDNGINNNYRESLTATDVSHAISPTFTIPNNAADYIVRFDWRANGQVQNTIVQDALNVWLVPSTYNPTKNFQTNATNSGGILVKENLSGITSFKREFAKMNLKDIAGKSMKLIFEWRNNQFTHNQKPAAIDNISIYEYACAEPKDLVIPSATISMNQASVSWQAPNAAVTNYDVLIRTNTDYPVDETGAIHVPNATNYTFKNLNSSTYYYVWYRSVCSTTDKSYWVGPVKFMTTCGVWNTPFFEGFESDATSFECWNYINMNPKDTDLYQLTTNSSYRYSGLRGLMFQSYAAATVAHDAYAISPTVELDGSLYKLTYYYKTSPSGNNEFEVLLSTDGKDISKFTQVLLDSKPRQKNAFVKETIFIKDIIGNINLAWHVKTNGTITFQIDEIKIEKVNCAEPMAMNYDYVKSNSVQLIWEDTISSEWEYTVARLGQQPNATGIKTTIKNPVVAIDQTGNPLQADNFYEYYVRVKCIDGTYGDWFGPVQFKTSCIASNVPYEEGFNLDETDLPCWTIVDVDKNAQSSNNIWNQSQYTVYEGNRCMYYNGTSPENNDWLISPGFNLTGGLYAVTFYYKLNKNTTANLSVKLSTSGTSTTSFTQTLASNLSYKGEVYTKKVVYVEGVTGVANIGFHVTGLKGTIQLDAFSIKPAVCRIPFDVEITDIGSTSVDLSWTDDTNTKWEYYIQVGGTSTLPAGSGSAATSKMVTANRITSSNLPLLPNTEYQAYVRSTCGTGKFSEWVGPLKFRTQCEVMSIPYREGFNSDSMTQYCWKIVDGNNDMPPQGNYGIWFAANYKVYEGDKAMYFSNLNGQNNDDWLMSPTFKLDKNKIYRVTYMHRTEPGATSEFEVKLSTSGRNTTDFNQVLVPKKIYDNVPWVKQKIFLSGIDGEVSLAFYVSNFTSWGSRTYIDDFFIEEVTTCTEPLTQGAENITGSSADIFWDNNYGTTEWEYFVRKKAFLVAPPLTNGTATTKNKETVTKDNYGANLEGNTWYEFYVRTKCKDGSKTEWTGPFYFRTACTYSILPFWEGFNGTDNSVPCWSYLDVNKDSTSPTGNNIWRQSTANLFEGSHTMNFTQTTAVDSDDYLVTPWFKQLDPTKTYRIKFHYLGIGAGDNEMELVASTKGNTAADFKQVIAPRASYKTTTYKEAIYYFTGIGPEAYFAWHVVGPGGKNITIDNVFIDEITTCAQPLNPQVKDVTTNNATLFWQDNFGATAWQYIILDKKAIAPTQQDKGAALTQKSNIVTKDHLGKALQPNTEYMYYVRTDCGNGKFSEWTGPVVFTTSCPIYQVPFEEGFNKNTRQQLCWSTVEGTPNTTKWTTGTLTPYEGDEFRQFNQTSSTAQADGYLISPTIELVAGNNYVLKYYYKTDLKNSNQFEVLLSKSGTDIANFTTTLLAKKAYNNSMYVQESVFISGISGNVNIAWHATVKGAMTLALDKVTIEKAASCPEPYNVRATAFTTNTIDVEWDQQGGLTSWEVFVVEYGNAIPAGASGVVVTGTPKYTATGLTSGKAYHIYVRAKCNGNLGMSNWSTPANGPTKVTANSACAGALTIPVNSGLDCIQKLGVSTIDAPNLDNNTRSNCMKTADRELWFEFTATSTNHLFEISNIIGLDKLGIPALSMTVYSGTCTGNIFGSQVSCYNWDSSSGAVSKDSKNTTINNLTPGNKYYVRLTVQKDDYMFNICITTSQYKYVTTSKNGDKYTTEELVKDILIKSDCDLVSNVKYNAGPNPFGNTLGYFNQNGSLFPFEEGIVLATHDVSNVPGPYLDYGDAGRRGKLDTWEGDPDLNAVIVSAGGNPYTGSMSVSVLEFDFIPVKDTIKFEYLMASESYKHNCTVVCRNAGSLFAAWLTEVETGQGQNLALVPGTNMPISLSTIRDTDRSGANCVNVNPEFYGEHYGKGQTDPLLAPINYIGMTKPMSSEPVYVKPGTKYRIKMAMADFCTFAHVSAVFFNGKSFDLGTLDLGADLTIDANTAVCSNEEKIIKSGLLTENVEISWTKDDVVIPGANQPNLAVSESGEYKVIAHYPTINCDVVGAIKVETFVPLSEIVHQAPVITYCRYVLGGVAVDLTQVEATMFKNLDRSRYQTTYYETIEAATAAIDAIANPALHSVVFSEDVQTRYIIIADLLTGCSEIFTVSLTSAKGAYPQKPADVAVCGVYVFTALPENQHYYEGPAATGTKYQAGDQLIKSGLYTIYVLQDNGKGCYEEVSFKIEITEPVVADVLEDKVYTCDVHTLVELTKGNKYFTASNGKGTELKAGEMVLDNQKIYIYKTSEDGLCYDESSFTISYEECPIPKGISPNGDGMNDTFDLTSNGVSNVQIYNRLGNIVYEFSGHYTNQWYGQNKQGKPLASGTYYYVLATRAGVVTGWVQLNY